MDTKYFSYKGNKVMLYLDSIRKGFIKFPPSLQISLTDYCGEKCYMCDHWKRANRVHFEHDKLIDFLDKAHSNGLETVCYSGGDPLMYKRVNEVMDWHLINDVEFGFITTGSVPIKKLNLDFLKHASFVRISLDAIDPKKYKLIRGVNASLYAQEVTKEMLSHGIKIGLGITLSKYNVDEIPALVDFTLKNGIKEFRVWPVRHSSDEINGIDITDQLFMDIKFAIDIFNKDGIDHNLDETINILTFGEDTNLFKTCKASLYQLFVDPSGNIFPCCIIAGDTEAEFMGEPLFTIDNYLENDYHCHNELRNWSEQHVGSFCIKNCTKRLSTINQVAEENWDKKLFF